MALPVPAAFVHIALGVGAAGGATKATIANVLKATRPRAAGRSGVKPHKARPRQFKRGTGKELGFKKTRAPTDRLE